MKNFFKIIAGFVFALILWACSKDDSTTVIPIRDRAEQYAADIDTIDWFIDNHFMTVSPNFDVTFAPLPDDGSQLSIRNQIQYPLQFKNVTLDGFDYKLYYINFREGISQKPSEVDSVFVSYRGSRLNLEQFDVAVSPVWLQLDNVVRGWREILPLFKTGTYDAGNSGPNPIEFADFGAGLMFIPSGLGYFSTNVTGLPAYSPMIFNFKLFELNYRDHDQDGILSKDEVETVGSSPLTYDLDGDGLSNLYDVDDDGDTYLTRAEITADGNRNSPIVIPYPTCNSGVPKYLDNTCH
jgi:FKBP-type peptidyl-prolyl cis-trans isomerase FkpA